MRFPKLHDSVHAMLAPGEMILTPEQQTAVKMTNPSKLLPEQRARLKMLARSKRESSRMPVQHFRRGGVAVTGGGPHGGGRGWRGIELGGIDIPEANMHDPFGGLAGERGRGFNMNEYGMPGSFANWGYNAGYGPGMLQGNTVIPTFFNSQGYPYAVPADYAPAQYNATSRHMGQRTGQ